MAGRFGLVFEAMPRHHPLNASRVSEYAAHALWLPRLMHLTVAG
jgi:hypothetical protein